jgi:hypothetical protein
VDILSKLFSKHTKKAVAFSANARHFAFFVVCKKGLRHACVSLREPCEIQGEEEVWHALCNNEK